MQGIRLSTQLMFGFALAACAAVAVGVFAFAYSRALQGDLDEIAEEWAELDAVTGSVAALRHATTQPDSARALRLQAERLEELEPEDAGDRLDHDTREAVLLRRLVALLRQSAADPQATAKSADEAEAVASSFWREDLGRVDQQLVGLRKRQARLRTIGLWVGGVLLSLPLLILWIVHVRIGRPLARIQARVAALAGASVIPKAHRSGMAQLESAIGLMAATVEARQASLEDEVEARNEQLRHADRLGGLGRIAAAVAHELNTPLGSIGLSVDGLREALAKTPVDRALSERCLATMESQVEACTATTRKLLTYAHLRPPEPGEATVVALVAQAADLVEAHYRRRGVHLDTSGLPRDLAVRGDTMQLRQVVVNLLLNAADASPRGESVSVECVRLDDSIALRIRDRGCGIPLAEREKVFNPFFTTKRPGEGTGLGLSIAREIVEAHGGTLRVVASDDGEGSDFEFRLPLAPVNA